MEFCDSICRIYFNRTAENNTITDSLIAELHDVLSVCEEQSSVVVLEGSREVFCTGADFQSIIESRSSDHRALSPHEAPKAMYELWQRMALGPFITIAHVQGRVNAGGIGFIAASDVVLASEQAQFSLSELLFGLYPACVLPFLVRRIGFQRANYLTLTTQPISASQACEWGLVDAVDAHSDRLLQRHLQRFRRLTKTAIRSYKTYARNFSTPLQSMKDTAVKANVEIFGSRANLRAIINYVEHGVFPWEQA